MSHILFILLLPLMLTAQTFNGSHVTGTNPSVTCTQPTCKVQCHAARTCQNLTILANGASVTVLDIECSGAHSCQHLSTLLPLTVLTSVNITCLGENACQYGNIAISSSYLWMSCVSSLQLSCHHLVLNVSIQYHMRLLCQHTGCQHSQLVIQGAAGRTSNIDIVGMSISTLQYSLIHVSDVETLNISCADDYACTNMQLSLANIGSSTMHMRQGAPFFNTEIGYECDQTAHMLSCPSVLQLRCSSDAAGDSTDTSAASCVECTMDDAIAQAVILFDNIIKQWTVSALCASISTTTAIVTSMTTESNTVTTTTTSSDTEDLIKAVLLVLCAVFVVILIVLIVWYVRRQKQKRQSKGQPIPRAADERPPVAAVHHDHQLQHHYNQQPHSPPMSPHNQPYPMNQAMQMQFDPRVHGNANVNVNAHVMPHNNQMQMQQQQMQMQMRMQSPKPNPNHHDKVKVFVQHPQPNNRHMKPDPRELELYDTSRWHKRTAGESNTDDGTFPHPPLQPGEKPEHEHDIFRHRQKSSSVMPNNSFDSSEMYKTFQNRQNGILNDDPEELLRQWMAGIVGLPQYTHLLIANDIRIEEMPTITREDLTKIGITSVGHQLKILQNAQDLKQLL